MRIQASYVTPKVAEKVTVATRRLGERPAKRRENATTFTREAGRLCRELLGENKASILTPCANSVCIGSLLLTRTPTSVLLSFVSHHHRHRQAPTLAVAANRRKKFPFLQNFTS